MIDNYTNLTPRTVEGLDLGLYYNLRDTSIGRFPVANLNGARAVQALIRPEQLELELQPQGTGEVVARVERDVDLLGESLVRFERGVHGEFDRAGVAHPGRFGWCIAEDDENTPWPVRSPRSTSSRPHARR